MIWKKYCDMRIKWPYGFNFFQKHLCCSSGKEEKTGIMYSVFLIIAMISIISNGGLFLVLLYYLRTTKNDNRENRLEMVI